MEPYYNPNIRILIIRRLTLRKWHYNNLQAPFWRLYWNSIPGATIRYQKQIIALTPERIVLVPPNTLISPRLDRAPVTHFHAHFLAEPPFARLHSQIYVFKAEPGMLSMIKNLPTDKQERCLDNLSLTMAVHGLIHYLLSKIPTAELQPQPLRLPAPLIENMAFIESHVRQGVTDREIARHKGLSVNAMLRIYKRELGIPPQRYLRLKRIEKACALLHDPQQSIKQIAEETGFCDRYHFSRVFKDLQRMTPCEYRRQFVTVPHFPSQEES